MSPPFGVVFEPQAPVPASAPNRADVACFVGLVDRRPGPLPAAVREWMADRGWLRGPYRRSRRAVDWLRGVPVPVDSWETFDRLFAWERRRLDAGGRCGASYLGAAVRSFFAQGGRKCYVVRVGRPRRYTAPRAARLALLERLVPGYGDGVLPSPADRDGWRGIAHLFGLPDVSFACLPDLADLVRPDPEPLLPLAEPEPVPEGWVECSAEDITEETPSERIARGFPAPRADVAGLRAWARAVRTAGRLTALLRREVQLVAAIPIPRPDVVTTFESRRVAAQDDLLRYLSAEQFLSRGLDRGPGISSAFVQLAYPWLRTGASGLLPEGLESPDGVLAGVLARNALLRGAYRSAGGLELGDVWDLHPRLGRDQQHRPQPYGEGREHEEGRSLIERVSLFGDTPAGLRLLSDVTTSLDDSYRPAPVNRLVSALVRAARRQGEDALFEASGEAVWARLRERLEDLLLDLLRAGALRGASAEEAFEVRCDRTTMSQNDLDNGRIVARVIFQPSAPVERIAVVLASEEGGAVQLLAPPQPVAEAA